MTRAALSGKIVTSQQILPTPRGMIMLRRCLIGLVVTAFAVAIVVAGRGDSSTAQTNLVKNVQPNTDLPPENGNGKALKPVNPLPISQVVLFNSGVGYFHRTGEVEGDARVDLQFQSSDINDLIKSLVIEDTRGKVLPLRYDSQEPIEKTLRSFAINLSSNPSFGQILNQARGEKVEITLNANNAGLPGTLSGTIVGMESAHRLPTPTSTATADIEFLNLMCSEGFRTVPINQIQRLRFLNATIENEFRRALEVVASGHDSLKKYVRLGFRGEGKREVKVGYVTENPIWKTSYRIVLDKNGKTKLLGWANVENTSDEDWHDVKLTLVSGRPISFQMDLYPPLFIPRPTVEPELFASLRPPTYSGPISTTLNLANPMGQGFGGGQGGQGGFVGNGALSNNSSIPVAQMPQQALMLNGANTLTNGTQLFANPMGNNTAQLGINRYQNFDNNNVAVIGQGKLTFKDLQQRRNDNNKQQQQLDQQQAKQIGGILTGVDPELVEAALTAEELGNPARFVIEEQVSLPRQQSAMIPILEQPIEATRVSIYNQRVQAKHPLFGLKMKNNSKQSLMQGPIAVYDDEQYAGDARILDLQPGEERFVSYAIDIGTEVVPFDKVVPAPEMTARMENGTLQVQYKLRTTRTYVIKNRSPESRKVVIEQPTREGWKFTEARKVIQTAPGKKGDDGMEKEASWKIGDIEKPTERTRDLYRFTVDVKSGETVKYEVSEELPRIDPFQNTRQADWTGFATTLGLDVWTDARRTPENQFGIEIVKNALKVTHKDRRTTTYFVKNRADVERTVWLEHFVPKGRQLVGDAKPDGEDGRRFRFKLVLAPGKTLSQTVVDQFENDQPETFALRTGGYTGRLPVQNNAPAPEVPAADAPLAGDLPADRFITDLGFEVWQTRQTRPETLVTAKFSKGELQTTAKNQETVAYVIRNVSAPEQTFKLDHHVRPQWSYVGDEKPVAGVRSCYRLTITAGKDQIVKREVTEEKTSARKETLESLNDERLKLLLASAGISEAVKENVRKGTAMIKGLEQTGTALKDLRSQLKEITDEQARIKGNLEKLPPTSEFYKRLIDKFDKKETELENVQKQIVEKVAQEKKQKVEYDGFREKLNVQ
jgi:hypothetical protein